MSTLNERRFYIYAYLRVDGTPYYIGRGTGRRIHNANHTVALPPYDRRRFLIVNLTSDEANELEVALIELFGRKVNGTGCLRNLTEGGKGTSGHRHSEDHKRYIRSHLRSYWQQNPTARKARTLKAVQTRKANYDEAARERAAKAQRGKRASAKTKATMSAAQKRRFEQAPQEHVQASRAKAAETRKAGMDKKLIEMGYEVPSCPVERQRLIDRVKSRRQREKAGCAVGQGPLKGEKAKNSRLNERLVLEIRAAQESSTSIAKRLGVSVQTVCNVRNRVCWAHVA